MAYEIPVLKPGIWTAGEDLSAKQYHFVKLSGQTVVLCSALTDVPIGVLQNAPESGQAAEVMCIGITKVNSDAALSVDDLIGTAADGQADAKVPGTDTTNFVVGRVIGASGAAGGLATALINCATPHRAA